MRHYLQPVADVAPHCPTGLDWTDSLPWHEHAPSITLGSCSSLKRAFTNTTARRRSLCIWEKIGGPFSWFGACWVPWMPANTMVLALSVAIRARGTGRFRVLMLA